MRARTTSASSAGACVANFPGGFNVWTGSGHEGLVGSTTDQIHHQLHDRVRPPNAREGRSALGLRTCVSVDEGSKTVRLKAAAGESSCTCICQIQSGFSKSSQP